jgi:hypothetical protein
MRIDYFLPLTFICVQLFPHLLGPLLPSSSVLQQLVEEFDGSQVSFDGHGFVNGVWISEVGCISQESFSLRMSWRTDICDIPIEVGANL